jgi:hypothetical protein
MARANHSSVYIASKNFFGTPITLIDIAADLLSVCLSNVLPKVSYGNTPADLVYRR